jgi:hypothetical protein
MQSAYEHGVRDGLARANTDGRDRSALEARLTECLRERETRQKQGWNYGSVSDQWLDRDIAALQAALGMKGGGDAPQA